MTLLQEAVIYLIAALIAVPISRKLGFGSVLGYLAAGIIIGPFGLGFIKDAEHILHFAELGVVFLLFVIGLELQPSRLWVLRRMVFGLGSAQLIISAGAIAAIGLLFGLALTEAVLVGFILALSSTAFVLQLLAEKKELTTTHGRAAFTILLFQDLAVIPLIAILPMFGAAAGQGFEFRGLAIAVAMIGGLIIGGHYLLRPVLRIAARTQIPEIFTATALLVVIGAALLMQAAGMSMVLGAFIAGMLLADSEYRHELEADIAPFKGMLLGLFFIAVGMSVNLGLLVQHPGTIMLIVICLMVVKAAVLFPLARLFGICDIKGASSLAAVLSQGGEFAFVLFAIAARHQIIQTDVIDQLILAVAVSMLLTPVVYLLNQQIVSRMEKDEEPGYDQMEGQQHAVIIAGFGRFGQIVGRLLAIVGRPFTALEIDASQVDVVRKYGNIVYYGDASKLDLLRAAGAEHARLFVLAIDDIEASIKTAQTVTRHFPDLTIVARARNRRHEYHLMDLGIKHIFRETLLSSLAMTEQVLFDLGFEEQEVHRLITTFREKDAQLIREQHAVQHDEEQLIQTARDTARELELLLRSDLKQ
ncbi:MAG: glutathione-regulated potassium-efflux system protein KefB [Gammaproteobacteria bacterium]|nr:MAG: glutathione-regulated potassium-efflux system protein KefB [Gammaproteobacteria bacterium]